MSYITVQLSKLNQILKGFPAWLSGKESASNAGDTGFDLWIEKIPWSRTHPSSLTGKTPQTEEPDGLQSVGLQSWTQLSD